jgi:hypothetical protein
MKKTDRKKREKIYDEQISPLMKQIIEICKANDMSIFNEIEYAPGDFCRTNIPVEGAHLVFEMFSKLSHCKIEGGVNVDAFFIWLINRFPDNNSSFYINLAKRAFSPKP